MEWQDELESLCSGEDTEVEPEIVRLILVLFSNYELTLYFGIGFPKGITTAKVISSLRDKYSLNKLSLILMIF